MLADNELGALLEDASITALIGTFTIGEDTYPAIENGFVIPADWDVEKCINFYRTGPAGVMNYRSYNYSVNCRAVNKSDAEAIAEAVETVVHRYNADGVNFVVDILPTIPPQDETDIYNTPLEVRAKKRR